MHYLGTWTLRESCRVLKRLGFRDTPKARAEKGLGFRAVQNLHPDKGPQKGLGALGLRG